MGIIKSVQFKFGKSPTGASLKTDASSVTVFVGPNNSGKSKVLNEILHFCSSGYRDPSNVVLDNLDFEELTQEEALSRIEKVTIEPHVGEVLPLGSIVVGGRGNRRHVSRESMVKALLHANSQTPIFCSNYLAFGTLMLDGASRMNLVNPQPIGDLQAPPTTSFQYLFRDNDKRSELRRLIFDAFGQYFVLDPTTIGSLKIRFSNRPPQEELEEKGIHETAVKFHAQATPIEAMSDGVKAFVGIVTEIVAGDPAVILIDEPEAFLHPSLSFMLGKEVSYAGSASKKNIFVSTHSPYFVMGCVQSGARVNIIRLTYRAGIPTARSLSSENLLQLMRNPLLRSIGVLSALFYEFVVVTESDADRAFYQEINERLLRYRPDLGIPNCLFLNAQNKQTIRTIIRPLRELGIPAAAIVDVDVLKEGGSVWASFLEGGFVPDIDKGALASSRASLMALVAASGKDFKREGGVDILAGVEKEAAFNLFDALDKYGLFAVRHGELESWLSHMNVSGHGPAWLVSMFGKMGDDPESDDYLHPSEGDVWEFVIKIGRWMKDAKRRGLPD